MNLIRRKLIPMRFPLLFAVGLLLAGCAPERKPTDTTVTDGDGTTVVKGKDGSTTIYKDGSTTVTHKDSEGKTLTTNDETDTERFKGLVYPGAKLLPDRGMTAKESDGSGTFFAAWTTADKPEKVAKFYEAMSKEAHAVTTKTDAGTFTTVLIPFPDKKRDVQIGLSDSEGVTEIGITINQHS